MGRSSSKVIAVTPDKNIAKMAFYMLQQPFFTLEPVMSSEFNRRMPSNCNISDELLHDLMTIEYETDSEYESDFDQQMDENHDENEKLESSKSGKVKSNELVQANMDSEVSLEKAQKFKQIMNKVNVSEDVEKTKIHIELSGYQFKAEHLEVRVVNGNILEVKAEHGDQKYQKQFKLAPNVIIEKIESKFNTKEEKQILSINVPKDVKIVQVPIAMDEN